MSLLFFFKYPCLPWTPFVGEDLYCMRDCHSVVGSSILIELTALTSDTLAMDLLAYYFPLGLSGLSSFCKGPCA